jgi:hypothetical protein
MFDDLRYSLRRSPGCFFFRDDDADRDVPELRKLLRMFALDAVPLSLAVIPGTLQVSGVRLLCDARRSQPLELHQHGWMHANREVDGRKCEFGPSRSFEQQFEDITLGRQRLEDAFAENTTPLFTPPWNRCTSVTEQVLGEIGFLGLSKIYSPQAPRMSPRLIDASVSVDIFHWRGGLRLKSHEELTQEIREHLRRDAPIGILLHHKVMDANAFHCVSVLLAVLRESGSDVRTMEALCPLSR